MTEEREDSNSYTIPPIYTDSGKLLGGMLAVSYTHLDVYKRQTLSMKKRAARPLS